MTGYAGESEPYWVTETEKGLLRAEVAHYTDCGRYRVLDEGALDRLGYEALTALHRETLRERFPRIMTKHEAELAFAEADAQARKKV